MNLCSDITSLYRVHMADLVTIITGLYVYLQVKCDSQDQFEKEFTAINIEGMLHIYYRDPHIL